MEKISPLRQRLILDGTEICSVVGCLLKKNATKDELTEYMPAPLNLFPTPFPFHLYKQIYLDQGPIGIAVSNLAANPELLWSQL